MISVENTDAVIECPFCSFYDSHSLYIAQHIEYSHPDKHDSPDRSRSQESCSEPEYIECECGEDVALSEFTGHMVLHLSKMTKGSNSNNEGHSPIPPSLSTETATVTTLQLNSHCMKRVPIKHADYSEQLEVLHSIRNFAGRFFGLPSSNTRPYIPKRRPRAPQRLGVRFSQA
jgi:hypothetical protein